MNSALLNPEKLQAAAEGNINVLMQFDRHGMLLAPGESSAEFAARMQVLSSTLGDLEQEIAGNKVFEAAPGIKISRNEMIPQQIYDESLKITQELYAVKPDWVPGFFANESFGALWGGCALSDPASGLVLFIIRKVFRKQRRWLVYDRRELMAHELTHAAHGVFDEWQFEEYFAYRSAESALRRFFGGCFIHKFDAMGFLLPILLLPVVQFLNLLAITELPMWIFWLLAAVYPVFLVSRCINMSFVANRARKFLRSLAVAQVDAVLFRLSCKEIKMLAAGKLPEQEDLRWQIIRKRFFPGE